MKLPNRTEAMDWLNWAGEQNPGPWTTHSMGVARAAERIAERCGMEKDAAYCMGLLHDIGRYAGVRHMHHIVAGYQFMMEKGYPEIARICVTHSFPTPDIDAFFGKPDVTAEEFDWIVEFIREAQPFTEYDKLIQLCDAISKDDGVCLMEKRMVDVAMRYGTKASIAEKWKATFAIKKYFEEKLGHSIYDLFEEVAEYTFHR